MISFSYYILVSSQVDSSYIFLVGMSQKWCCYFLPIKLIHILITWLPVCLTGFSIGEIVLIIFLFVKSKYLVGRWWWFCPCDLEQSRDVNPWLRRAFLPGVGWAGEEQHRSELYWASPRSPAFHSGKFPVDTWMGRWMQACMDQCGVLGSRHRMDTRMERWIGRWG